jgi:hypothetical protein
VVLAEVSAAEAEGGEEVGDGFEGSVRVPATGVGLGGGDLSVASRHGATLVEVRTPYQERVARSSG